MHATQIKIAFCVGRLFPHSSNLIFFLRRSFSNRYNNEDVHVLVKLFFFYSFSLLVLLIFAQFINEKKKEKKLNTHKQRERMKKKYENWILRIRLTEKYFEYFLMFWWWFFFSLSYVALLVLVDFKSNAIQWRYNFYIFFFWNVHFSRKDWEERTIYRKNWRTINNKMREEKEKKNVQHKTIKVKALS